MTLPRGFENPDPVGRIFDSLIAVHIIRAGHEAVPVPEFRSVHEEQLAEHGIDDPIAAQQDNPTEIAIATSHAIQALQERHHVSKWLTPAIIIRPASVEGKTAYWDGTNQGLGSALDWLAGNEYFGTLPAFSLCIVIGDSSGTAIHHEHAGIELARKPGKEIPREKMFTNMERNEKAVRRALKPYFDQLAKEPGIVP